VQFGWRTEHSRYRLTALLLRPIDKIDDKIQAKINRKQHPPSDYRGNVQPVDYCVCLGVGRSEPKALNASILHYDPIRFCNLQNPLVTACKTNPRALAFRQSPAEIALISVDLTYSNITPRNHIFAQQEPDLKPPVAVRSLVPQMTGTPSARRA